MIGWNGAEVIGTLVAVVLGMFYGPALILVAGAKLHARILARLERSRWVTTYANECPNCKRKEVRRTGMYDADLGWECVSSYETCWSCRYHANTPLVIDLDSMSSEQIRALVPETYETGQVFPFDPRAPHCMGDGRARMRTASE